MVNTYQLRSTIEALYSGAETFTQTSSQLREVTNQLTATSQSLVNGQDRWQGQAARGFTSTWNQYQSDSQRIANDLEAIAPILRTLAEGLEAALAFAQELEQLDPLAALARLDIYVAHSVQVFEHEMVEQAIQVMLNEAVMEVDRIAAATLSAIVLEDIAQISVSPEYKWLQNKTDLASTILGDVVPIVEQVVEKIPKLEKANPFVKKFSTILDIFNVGLEYYSGSKHDIYTLEVDMGGDIIENGVALTGVGKIIEVVAASVQLLSMAEGWTQSQFAHLYTGTTRQQLEDPAHNLELTAKNADISTVFKDVAKLVIDSHGMLLSPTLLPILAEADILSRVSGVNNPLSISTPTMLSDEGQLLADTGRLVLSPIQLVVNTEATIYDDVLSTANTDIQNLPLPESIKRYSSNLTPTIINSINDNADFITKPEEIEKIGTNAWNQIISHL